MATMHGTCLGKSESVIFAKPWRIWNSNGIRGSHSSLNDSVTTCQPIAQSSFRCVWMTSKEMKRWYTMRAILNQNGTMHRLHTVVRRASFDGIHSRMAVPLQRRQ
uniref:Uncharacterized protein n=1 Tax=Parascaris univalens TaxID=6257 RepID=A0A914ZZC6_PARUN